VYFEFSWKLGGSFSLSRILVAFTVQGISKAAMRLLAIFFWQMALDISILVYGAALVEQILAESLLQGFNYPFAPIDYEEYLFCQR
jgi:hypothetical protein